MGEMTEEEAREAIEKVQDLAEEHDINDIEEAIKIVESESSSGLTEDQKDAAKTIFAGGLVVTGSVFGPAGIVASSAAAAYVVKDYDTVVSAYKDGGEQAATVYKNLRDRS